MIAKSKFRGISISAIVAAACLLLQVQCRSMPRDYQARHAPNFMDSDFPRALMADAQLPGGSSSSSGSVGGNNPGPVLSAPIAVKKIIFLKLKTVVPISMILLRSDNAADPQLVPVYPTSEIPPNVHFIPTPNGFNGDSSVQAIAMPSEVHEHLMQSGVVTIDDIQTSMIPEGTALGGHINIGPMQLPHRPHHHVPEKHEAPSPVEGHKKHEHEEQANEGSGDAMNEAKPSPDNHNEKPAAVPVPIPIHPGGLAPHHGPREGPSSRRAAGPEHPIYFYSMRTNPFVERNPNQSLMDI